MIWVFLWLFGHLLSFGAAIFLVQFCYNKDVVDEYDTAMGMAITAFFFPLAIAVLLGAILAANKVS